MQKHVENYIRKYLMDTFCIHLRNYLMEIKLFREMISQFGTGSWKFPDCEIPRIGVLVGNVKFFRYLMIYYF